MATKEKWGYLRENKVKAKEAGIDETTGLHRNGLEEYLKEIYPNVNDWVCDKEVPGLKNNGERFRGRPDYRSESLKLIIEFDGLHHYTNPLNIRRDKQQTEIYTAAGYKVVRIPYFIQLTQEAVETLFGVKHPKPLFNPIYASLGVESGNTPAFLCLEGIGRMKEELKLFPDQRDTNIKALQAEPDQTLALWQLIVL